MLANGGIPRSAVIREMGDKAINNLDDFTAVISELHDKEKIAVRYFTSGNTSVLETRVVYMEHQWFAVKRCKRNNTGSWPCKEISVKTNGMSKDISSTSFVMNGDALVNKLAPSLVMVNFDAPYYVEGIAQTSYYGSGLVINAKKGYVLVDRNTVPISIGDVRLTFAGSLEISGKVEYMHPVHNLAVVSYDPELIGSTPVKNAQFDLRPLRSGEDVTVVGLQADHKLLSQRTQVASIDEWAAPLSSYFGYRDINIEVVSLVNAPENIDGVILDKKGRVRAKWASFSYSAGRGGGQLVRGIPAEYLAETAELVEQRNYRSAEIEFSTITLAGARKRGLPNDWANKLEQHNPERRKVLEIERSVSGSPAADLVVSGDLLLAVDGKPVTSFRDVEKAMQKAEIELSLWRNNEVLNVKVPTVSLSDESIDRVVVWAGAYLHKPHRELLAQRTMATDGVYVSYYSFGSPATRYGLWAGQRIVEIDGQDIKSLDDLVAAVKNKQHRESLRIKTLAWNNQARVITLKLDTDFWPFYELTNTAQGWQRRDL
jgi:S1-C subfamily serine protease